MQAALGRIADAKYPHGWFFDDHMRQIPDHYHLHARPYPRWWPLARERGSRRRPPRRGRRLPQSRRVSGSRATTRCGGPFAPRRTGTGGRARPATLLRGGLPQRAAAVAAEVGARRELLPAARTEGQARRGAAAARHLGALGLLERRRSPSSACWR